MLRFGRSENGFVRRIAPIPPETSGEQLNSGERKFDRDFRLPKHISEFRDWLATLVNTGSQPTANGIST
jgi:hypothetical protein